MSSLLDNLFRRRAIWVTGKGGVGKSSIAAALALLSAERGQRTLLIDVEARGDAARFLDAGPARYDARQVTANLYHLALEPEAVLDEYLNVALRVPRVRRFGPVRKIFDFIATGAPGVKEVLIAGKVGFEERAAERGKPRWDVIVIDAAPSGQVVSHLRGPRSIQEMVGVGLIREQTSWVRDIIEDPNKTCVVVVALPEEMPVVETQELLQHLPEAVNTPVLGIIANRVIDAPPDRDVFASVAKSRESWGNAAVALDAAVLAADIADDQSENLEKLRSLGPPTACVPLIAFDRHGMEATRRIAHAISESNA